MGTGTVNSKFRYIESLKKKHRSLDNEILSLPISVSEFKVKELKTKKLHIKQEIAKLTNELNEV
jgi:hypothetical protein